jgi:threonine dehydrogenase-like Zn-dependent dehydrogenase
MQAVYLEAGTVSVRKVAEPLALPGYALLRLRLAGICNTDLELQRGYYGFQGIPGHEFVADVIDAEDKALIGKRVVGEINLACGTCSWCQRSMGRHCPTRTVLGIVKHPGAFAESLTLPVANLHLVPAEIPDEVAVFTEPVAAACAILEQVTVDAGTPVAVLGDGKLGLLAAMVLTLAGADVQIFGRHPEKMTIAKEVGVRARASDDAGRQQFPLVVEATGSSDGLATAIGMTEARGKIVMKSTVNEQVRVDMASVIVPEISLVGSRCGRFTDALPLLAGGKLPVARMVHATYGLSDAAAAFAHAARKGTLKVLLRP